jgi:hypothetical protein
MSDEANKLANTINANHALFLNLMEARLRPQVVSAPPSEQELFYGRVNHFVEEHPEEINLGVSVIRYGFWKTLFLSKPGKVFFLLILLGLSTLCGPKIAAWIWASLITLTVPLLAVFTVVVVIVGCILGATGKSANAHTTTEDGEPLYSTETGEPLYTNHKGPLFYILVVMVTIILCIIAVFCF